MTSSAENGKIYEFKRARLNNGKQKLETLSTTNINTNQN